MKKLLNHELKSRLQTVINTHYQGDWSRIAEIMNVNDNEPRVVKIIRLCEAVGVNPDWVVFGVGKKDNA